MSPPKGSPVHGEGKISLRVDQPVEGCQVMTHAFFRSVDGDIDDKVVEMRFRWYRSLLRRACANPECPRQGEGNVLLLVAKIECVLCCRLGLTRDQSCFCSPDCFRLGWHKHKQLHANIELLEASVDGKLPWKSQLYNIDALCPAREDKWIEITQQNDRTYTPSFDDVGHVIRVECQAIKYGGGHMLTKTVDTGIVLPFPPMPPKRQMLANVHEERPTPRLRQIGVFRVLTYNILAEIYATRQMYPYCPVWALNWSFRRELLQRELQSYNADIICLQEVQDDHYKKFFYPMMAEWGYEGWYLKKTRESMGLEGKVDGCAFFYKRNRFIMKEQYPLEFNEIASDYLANAMNEFDMAYPTATMADRESFHASISRMRVRIMRDNVGQIAVLEVIPSNIEVSRKHTGPLLCIANVHIFSNPKFPDVKLWQSLAMMKQIERVALARHLPIIFCGDFNSEPTSAVYELMTRNHVSIDHPDLQELTDLFASMDLDHHIGFGSAYASVFGAEPEYTNYTGHWTGVADYVWYTPELLTPFAGLKVHPPEVLESYSKTALPNCQYTSDHVPLCLDFCFKAAALMNNGRY
ncbi:hypothetical protein Poli38472_003227 [Pythium oligandrum]|uniref:Endonuclease/exonuclease/phosphatase domain-containing protein n=1 Tax=Pythium oligandrum TaxID=41045 RepID=A0A8K1FF47_PYTOL|nr:hypothetical protein Poli38472_003227 [Pythium oligandrum]|eukprot:TMW57302.1 hypothetical protein Poli38472_003227 [Pythium oligandrum]